MGRHKPVVVPAEAPTPTAARYVIALGCAAITGAAIVSSLHPTAGNWGLHAAGFLAPAVRNALLAAMVVATGVVGYGLFGPRASQTSAPPTRRLRKRLALIPWLLLLAWLLVGSWYPVKEALLGDSAVLIQDVQSETLKVGNEPLSMRILDTAADALSKEVTPLDHATLGLVSRVAAVAAGLLLALIAGEIGVGASAAFTVLALLLTLGTTQFYLGYVEAYPIALVFVLLYLWLGLRAARGAAPTLVSGGALGLAATAHVATLLLFPSYVVLAFRAGSRARGAASLLVPLVVAGALFAALGFDFEQLMHPFRVAAQAAAPSAVHDVFRRPYGFVSLGHLADMANAVVLTAPVAFVLLAGAALALPRKPADWPAPLRFLAAAGIPGILVTAALMTPVAPAQDWDLFAFLLAPGAILGIASAGATTRRVLHGTTAWGLAALSLAILAPFVLVNADSPASIARFERLVGDPARVSPYGRAYGNEILWILHRDRGQADRALAHARAAFEAEPTNPRYEINYGHALLVLRRVNEAIPHFQAATAAAPTRWDAPYNLGLSYSSLRRYPEALTALAEAHRRDPERPEVWAAQVHALVRSGQQDSAETLFLRLKDRFPAYVEEQEKKHAARQQGRTW